MRATMLCTLAVLAATLLGLPLPGSAAEAPLPIRYHSNFSSGAMVEAIRKDQRFENLSERHTGSPVMLAVTHRMELSRGELASLATSALVTVFSAGLIPVVTHFDLVVDYDIVVHNDIIATFSYRRYFSDADRVSELADNELERPQLDWALTTVDSFLRDVGNDAAVQNLIEEYRYYFGH